MRIAIFTNNYLPNPYGVSMSIETFRKSFEQLGHTVYIFAPNFPGYIDKNSSACPSGRQVFRYPAIDVNVKFRFPLAIPYSMKIGKVLKALDIDVIHAQHPNLLGSAAARWAKKKKIPLIFTWHTLYDKYTNFVPFLPKKIVSDYIIKKAVNFANKADAVIAPTDSIIPILREWGVKNDNVFAVATGIEEEKFVDFKKETIREKYNIADDEILLFTMARLTGEKNLEFIFRSVEDILKNNNKVKLLVSGDGYLLPELRRFCEERGIGEKVIFSGLVPREEVKNYYAAADIFIYASTSETQGMILMEAMHMNLPIVAVEATGTKNLVLNGGNGFLVGEDSPREMLLRGNGKAIISQGEKEFAAAISKLIEDKSLRESFGLSSGKIARTKFTSLACAKRMLDIYQEARKNYLN